ncbi:MAG: fumarylacetoacetate hydrolase family protein [Gammaproteobacteria bacterium]|nr:fumarylacetoacetate hydrolase family protein [Gammaproteobacteria bacterium]
MKLASFTAKSGGESTIGVLIGDHLLDLHAASSGALPRSMVSFLEMGEQAMETAKSLAGKGEDAANLHAAETVELRAPVPRPGKILHTSCNFGRHLEELTNWTAPDWQAHGWDSFHFEHPTGFLEAPSSIVGSGAKVMRPVFTKQLDYEIELGIVIGKMARRVSQEHALDYVAGYTVFNDISARDIQGREHANKVILLGKSFDTSCPLGPYLVTTDEIPDPTVLDMELRLNGEVRQKAKTGDMTYKPDQLVSWWSNITLEPGDLITSGSPAGVIASMKKPVWLKAGDLVEAEIEAIGVLVSPIGVEGEAG